MEDAPRLIEHAFPLKQASLDSVHEKNVRHGHISTLHIWPARRPLAACRAALIATLLPDPSAQPKPDGMSDEEWHKEVIRQRQELCEKIGGKIVKKIEKKRMPNGQVVEREKEITEGGILHWGREAENKETLDWLRKEIRKAYGGRPPKVLDPFAGGGAIPLEAMRLGCEATAVDINPVAWFILKCTLEYPQKLAGKTWPLPDFILENEEFMGAFYKAHPHLVGRTKWTKKQEKQFGNDLFLREKGVSYRAPQADLAWHVRAWGQWVLDRARRQLAQYYPTYADFEPLDLKNPKPYEKQPMRLVPLKEDGTPDIGSLNAEFSKEYLADKRNPRWVAKPTVAYLWARIVTCKNCRATIPLLKTRWLCKKDKKRVLLSMEMVGRASVPAQPSQPVTTPQGKDAFSMYRRRLPHWRLEGATYFLTWRLHYSQPELGPDERGLVVSALRHFEGTRYRLHAFVVLNDHVHVLVEPIDGHDLTAITHSWKSYTANLFQRRFGRKGAVWQDESFDRIVRDETEFLEKAQYIQNNPFKRWPELVEYEWVGFPQWERTGTEACPTTPRVVFGIENDVPIKGGNTAQRREHDKRLGAGTMSRSGAKCPCCPAIMTMEDIRLEGQAGRLGAVSTAVVVDGQNGKQYRLPTEHEREMAGTAADALSELFAEIPFGMPDEPLPSKEALGFRVPLYGFDKWSKLFTPRQLVAVGMFVGQIAALYRENARLGFAAELAEALSMYSACMTDRLANQSSNIAHWNMGGEKIEGTFARFALPILWDFAEVNPLSEASGGFPSASEWVALVVEHLINVGEFSAAAYAINRSAIQAFSPDADIIITDPPYYDAIPYSDLMDFFYIWLRRSVHGLSPEFDSTFREPLSPKWDQAANDGELIDDASRHGGDAQQSKVAYEDGMARAFQACHTSLAMDGRLVVVFAHKKPDAWETLASAIIRAGFVVDGSWPIQTERVARTRSLSSAALSSSVWLVCKKRPSMAKPGWDNQVLEEMRRNIREKLRDFWDAGIRGPDFVWAATGPALEAYSKHPVVKKANDPGHVMTVSEFLTHVRRMVVDFVVGRVMYGEDDAGTRGRGEVGTRGWGDAETGGRGDAGTVTVSPGHRVTASVPESPVGDLDEPTAYYLLHRHDFGMDEAPAGACILYAISCGISDKELAGTWDLIGFTKGKSAEDEEDAEIGGRGDAEMADEEADPDAEEDSGSKVKLKTWAQRKGSTLGYEAPSGKPVPLIDRVHCLMHLWKVGDLHKVDEYLDDNGLRRQELFKRLLQSLIELSPQGSEERSLLESISNHVQAKGAATEKAAELPLVAEENDAATR